MIRITRLDGSQLRVNPDLIQWIESAPDTVITLLTGDKLLVSEPVDEVVSRLRAWRRGRVPSTRARWAERKRDERKRTRRYARGGRR